LHAVGLEPLRRYAEVAAPAPLLFFDIELPPQMVTELLLQQPANDSAVLRAATRHDHTHRRVG